MSRSRVTYSYTAEAGHRRPLAIAAAVAGIGLTGIAVFLGWPYLSALSDADEARRLVVDAGMWAPVVFVAMQVTQVLVAPIPGQVTALLGGYLFGTFWGLTYTMVGAAIGFTLIFVLSRRIGRPFVERVAGTKLERFDHLAQTKGVLTLFLIYLLPAFPDDVISFIAGLSRIRIRTLVLVSLAGRLPGYLVLSATGDGLAYENFNPVIVGAAVIITIVAVAYWNRTWLTEMVRSGDVISFARRRWTLSRTASIILLAATAGAAAVLYLLATVQPIQQ